VKGRRTGGAAFAGVFCFVFEARTLFWGGGEEGCAWGGGRKGGKPGGKVRAPSNWDKKTGGGAGLGLLYQKWLFQGGALRWL